jgi:hypothetical protein
MGEVNPYGQAQQFTPRDTNIVDAIAETKRITDAALRSNPLRNARVDDGLMQWRGNYSGGVANSGAFLWVGEFSPIDGVLGKSQRGFVLTRDDPKHAAALWMYDPAGSTANPISQPLRQRIFMRDADNRPFLEEGVKGGASFPWCAIPLFPAQSDSPGSLAYRHAINGANGTFRTLWQGRAPMVGPFLKWHAFVTGTAGQVLAVRVVLTWSDGSTYTSSGLTGTVAHLDQVLDFSGQGKVGQGVNVELQGGIVSGPADFNWIYPTECNSFG